MKVRKLVNSILTFGMVFILFITLPVFEQTAYAGNALEAKLNVSSQKVVKGKTFTLRVYNLKSNQTVTFSSSRPGVATVNSYGVVSAIDNGNATITAKVYEAGKIVTSLTCDITVGPPAIAVMISKLSLDLVVGEQARLTYLVFPINTAEAAIYSSNDESVASVSPGGRVIGEGPGSTRIFCMISKGVYATCEVTVHPKEEEPESEAIEDTKLSVKSAEELNEALTEVPVAEENEVTVSDDETKDEPLQETEAEASDENVQDEASETEPDETPIDNGTDPKTDL